MQKLNVRCCCQPTKILGTLELDPLQVELARTRGLAVVLQSQDTAMNGRIDVIVEPEHATICARTFFDGFDVELAIYSDDRPIEFWRRVRGFKEAVDTERQRITRINEKGEKSYG